MQFIDLATQQKQIRSQIEAHINTVLDHGQYILGPEVTELEKQIETNHQKYIDACNGRDKRIAALKERVAELEEAMTVIPPDLDTMAYVKKWFAKNISPLTGEVTGVITDPIVGKLIAAVDETLVAEFYRRFRH